jgi:hypothetical protein
VVGTSSSDVGVDVSTCAAGDVRTGSVLPTWSTEKYLIFSPSASGMVAPAVYVALLLVGVAGFAPAS